MFACAGHGPGHSLPWHDNSRRFHSTASLPDNSVKPQQTYLNICSAACAMQRQLCECCSRVSNPTATRHAPKGPSQVISPAMFRKELNFWQGVCTPPPRPSSGGRGKESKGGRRDGKPADFGLPELLRLSSLLREQRRNDDAKAQQTTELLVRVMLSGLRSDLLLRIVDNVLLTRCCPGPSHGWRGLATRKSEEPSYAA